MPAASSAQAARTASFNQWNSRDGTRWILHALRHRWRVYASGLSSALLMWDGLARSPRCKPCSDKSFRRIRTSTSSERVAPSILSLLQLPPLTCLPRLSLRKSAMSQHSPVDWKRFQAQAHARCAIHRPISTAEHRAAMQGLNWPLAPAFCVSKPMCIRFYSCPRCWTTRLPQSPRKKPDFRAATHNDKPK